MSDLLKRLLAHKEEYENATGFHSETPDVCVEAAARIRELEQQVAELVEALKRAKRTVKPFADKVYNDNGDMTVQGTGSYGDYCNAYWSERHFDELIAKHRSTHDKAE